MIKLTIRRKLLLASTTLLIIPWIGYQYIQEMQSYLHQNMESDLLSKVKLVAASMHERPALFKHSFSTDQSIKEPITITQHLYVRPIKSKVKLDGINDDWVNINTRVNSYGASNNILNSENSDLDFTMQLGSKKHSLYILIQVKDDHLVYRNRNSLSIEQSDRLIIAMQNREGEYVRYILTPKNAGWVNAYKIKEDGSNIPEIQIRGSWKKTRTGYNIEIRIPTYIIGEKLAFALADVDDMNTRSTQSIIATTNVDSLEQLGTIVVPSPKVEKLLSQIKQRNTRIWVLNKSFHVVGLSDQLLEDPSIKQLQDLNTNKRNTKQERSVLSGIMHLIYQQFLKQPSNKFDDDLSTASKLNTPEVLSALEGQATTAWRTSPDNRVSILTATHPIYSRGKVVGAIAIEETSNNILLLQNQAMEILINLSIITFLIAFTVLLTIAIRLSSRIRKLRDEAEDAITTDGKVKGIISSSTSKDEIGDLSRTSSNMLERLSQYNRYLEGMAGKLAHELRTPITVVRSSIENIEQNSSKDKSVYLQRASTGINRLDNILTRMSEASRLEQILQTEELEIFDIEKVIQGCVEGYQQANPTQSYLLQTNLNDMAMVNGSPDLIAQMLDKLISNANDYSKEATDIIIQLKSEAGNIVLKVMNHGEPLQHEMINNLFDSMVSLRKQKTDEPHLGLGLHIVKLIAEFHNGSVKAYNTDNKMVCFEVSLPTAN